MKILLLDTWRVIGSKGGTEKVFCNMANALSQRGHHVLALCCENKEGLPFFPLDKRVEFVNVGGITSFEKKLLNLRTAFYIKSLLRRTKRNESIALLMQEKIKPVIEVFKPDIIISFTREGAFWLKSNGFKLECPLITMYHFNAEKILDNEIYWSTLENCECLQTLLERDVKITLKTIRPKKIVTIPNVVPQVAGYANYSCNKIISIGRVEKQQKRQDLIIESYNILKHQFPNWLIEIWGETDVDKEYYKYLNDLVSKYGLEQNIKFSGTTDDVFSKLKDASIFACSSSYEGFGLALTEAMSSGLPCVGFKSAPAVNELIKDGSNGILCDDTVEDFARGLAELMNDADKRKRYGLQAKEDMKQYFPEKIWNKWEELINETIFTYKMEYDKCND